MRKLKEPGILPPPEDSKPDVETASAALVNAIKLAEQEERAEHVSAARAAVFENPHAAKEKPMPAAMSQIVASSFLKEEDMVAEKKELEELLDSSKKIGHQANSLAKAEFEARRAFKLWISFKDMALKWELDNQVVFSDMKNAANKALQDEKDAKLRSKMITDADLNLMCATMFPDEWRAQEIRRARAKAAEKSLEHLVEMYGSYCRSLGTLVGKGR